MSEVDWARARRVTPESYAAAASRAGRSTVAGTELVTLTLEDGVRIGSNAVVVKDVAQDETVVGVPGRILSEYRHHKFDAYGVSSGDDPTVERLNELEKIVAELAAKNSHNKDTNEL